MKLNLPILALLLLSLVVPRVFGQGFLNLNFEAAEVSGYSPNSYNVPVTVALPGWNAYVINSSSTNPVSQVWYDGISLGGALISIIDTNVNFGSFGPINGTFSAYLFGGGAGNPDSVQISQTGLVPFGTLSLLFNAYNAAAPFIVTIGGQVINMIPLHSLSNYTLYGGNISSMAGEVETLSFIEPPAPFGGPSFFELDNIRFSSSPVPEPGSLALAAFGAILAGLGFRRISSK